MKLVRNLREVLQLKLGREGKERVFLALATFHGSKVRK